jgi:hypothetical protein
MTPVNADKEKSFPGIEWEENDEWLKRPKAPQPSPEGERAC